MRFSKIVWAAVAAVLLGASLWQVLAPRPEAPALASPYADLTQFWRDAAASLKIEPEQGRLQQWIMGYDQDGKIHYLTFQLYIDHDDGTYDYYHYNQDSHQGAGATWSHRRAKGRVPPEAVPAHQAFAAVNRMGLRALEQEQAIAGAARFWFFGEPAARGYAHGYVFEGGQFTPIGPEGLQVGEVHGVAGIAQGALANQASVTTPADESGVDPIFVIRFQ